MWKAEPGHFPAMPSDYYIIVQLVRFLVLKRKITPQITSNLTLKKVKVQ